MTTIYLIRHAQASFGQANYDQLSTTGQLQAKVLGHYLGHILKQQPYVVTGTMQRHRDTAHLALQQCFTETSVQSHSGWNEFDHTEILKQYAAACGQTQQLKLAVAQDQTDKKQFMQLFKSAVLHWMSATNDLHYTESWSAFQQRVQCALDDLLISIQQHQAKEVIVFSSGGVIATLLGQILALNQSKIFQLNSALANVSISSVHLPSHTLALSDDNLLSVNEHHYLKAANCFSSALPLELNTAANTLLTWV